MLTKEFFEEQLRESMRNKEEVKKRTYRMILTAIKLAEVEKRGALDEPALLGILQKEVKVRQEEIADAEKAGRDSLAADSRAELDFLRSLLPKQMPAEELEELIRKVIAESGAATPADMGKVMKLVTPQTQGRADNREVSTLVRKLLGS